MTAQSHVRVLYRHVEIAATATVAEQDGGLRFVSLEAPPPVRTVLQLAAADGSSTAVEVVRAVEIADAADRGCVVRVLEAAPPARVGSEGLPDGAKAPRPEPAVHASEHDASDAAGGATAMADEPGYGAHMAVPAPVIGDDDSEPVDVGEASASTSDDDGSDESGTPAKKRRGRKRR